MRPITPQGRCARAWLALMVMTLGLSQLQCILIPEGDLAGHREANRPPTVQITGGVLADSTAAGSRVHFRWFGADEDGVVSWFEWALDDTTSEGAWHRTPCAEQVVLVPATQPIQGGMAADWHTFYVRAVDDQQARSQVVACIFNATTILPSSWISYPVPGDALRWAPGVRVHWRGEDLDAANIERRPAFYEIKHIEDPGVDITDDAAVRRLFEEGPNLLLQPEPDDYPADPACGYLEEAGRAWTRVSGSVTEVELSDMEIGRRYLFGVRAIDEAGAREQKFRRNENWVATRADVPRVPVFLYEPTAGGHLFDGSVFENPWRITVAPGQALHFAWQVDVEGSGSEQWICNYGVDVLCPDPIGYHEFIGPGSWEGWARRHQTRTPIAFGADQGPVHWFYLKVRAIPDRPEWETRCLVEIRVQDPARFKKLLIVDDQRRRPFSPGSPALRVDDAREDAWRSEVLCSLADLLPSGEQAGQFNTFPDEASSPAVAIPEDFLDLMDEYQTVVWDCAASDPCGLQTAVNDLTLSRYVGRGGNLLLLVWGGVVSTVTGRFPLNADDYCVPDLGNITGESRWNQFGFLWQHLHLRGPVDKPRGEERQRDRRSLVRAVAVDPSYPDIPLDPTRWGSDPRYPENGRGDWFYECLVPDRSEAGSPAWYERDEALRVLYSARCYTDVGHNLNDKPIAWSIDPARGRDPRPGYGRIVCLNFHPFYYDPHATEMAMSRALAWLMTGNP